METKPKPTLKTLRPLLTGRKKDKVDKFMIRASEFYSLKELYHKNEKTPDEKITALLDRVEQDLIAIMTDENFDVVKLAINKRVDLFKQSYSKLTYKDIIKITDIVKKYPTTYNEHLSAKQLNFAKGSNMLYSLASFFRNYVNEKEELNSVVNRKYFANLIKSDNIIYFLNLTNDSFDYQGFFNYFPDKNKKKSKYNGITNIKNSLITKNEKDVVNYLFVNARKYIKYGAWMDKIKSDKIPHKMRVSRAQIQDKTIKILSNEQRYTETLAEIQKRADEFKEKIKKYSNKKILEIVSIIKEHNDDFEDHLTNEQLDFIECCDMLNSMANFFEKFLNKSGNIKPKVKKSDIKKLTDSEQIKLFNSQVDSNFNIDKFVDEFITDDKKQNSNFDDENDEDENEAEMQ